MTSFVFYCPCTQLGQQDTVLFSLQLYLVEDESVLNLVSVSEISKKSKVTEKYFWFQHTNENEVDIPAIPQRLATCTICK